jgi:hypothetical protein
VVVQCVCNGASELCKGVNGAMVQCAMVQMNYSKGPIVLLSNAGHGMVLVDNVCQSIVQ